MVIVAVRIVSVQDVSVGTVVLNFHERWTAVEMLSDAELAQTYHLDEELRRERRKDVGVKFCLC